MRALRPAASIVSVATDSAATMSRSRAARRIVVSSIAHASTRHAAGARPTGVPSPVGPVVQERSVPMVAPALRSRTGKARVTPVLGPSAR